MFLRITLEVFFRRFPEVFERYFNDIIDLFSLLQVIRSHSCFLQPNQVRSVPALAPISLRLKWMVKCIHLLRFRLTLGKLRLPLVCICGWRISVLATVHLRQSLPSECRVSTGLHVLLLADVSSWYPPVLRIRRRECPCYTIVCFKIQGFPRLEVQRIVFLCVELDDFWW